MSSDLDRALHAQVIKRNEWREREIADQKTKRDEELLLGMGATNMCKAELHKLINADKRMYYRNEELNDKLYIQYKGWKEIQGLEGWINLRCLYAECNAFSRIQGLQTCTQLRSLFLQENCIRRIEGLENCTELWSINLSNNFIQTIEGLSNCKKLNTLIIAKNQVGVNGLEDLHELHGSSLATLDIQDNRISDPDVLPEVFVHMPGLRVLYMKGNEAAKKIPNYRKSTTQFCRDLRYLDDRPVFEDDRRAAEAFNRGGIDEERAERRRIRDEKNAAHDRNMRAFQEMCDRVKLEKREKEAMRKEDKYTVEEDPGLEKERQANARLEQWKKDNEVDNKDENLERAKRILEGEKEEAAKKEVDSTSNGASAPTSESMDESVASSALDGEANRLQKKKPKEDNRKLVYEDIWDDVPQKSAAGSTVASATPSATDVDSASFVAESSFQGARPGWYFGTGAKGLGYYKDKHSRADASSEVAAAQQKKQLETGVEKPAKAESRQVFAPPPRGAAAVAANAPEAAAASGTSSNGQTQDSELHEMD